MAPPTDIREHVNRIESCVVRLADIGEQRSEGVQPTTLLKSLAADFEAAITAMRTVQEQLAWVTCVANLIEEGNRQKSSRQITLHQGLNWHDRRGQDPGTSTSHALKAGPPVGNHRCFLCKNRGHYVADGPEEPLEDSSADEQKDSMTAAKAVKKSKSNVQEPGPIAGTGVSGTKREKMTPISLLVS